MRIAWIVLLTACDRSSSSPPPPTPTPLDLDPLGPCVKIEGKTCKEHDPLFAEATASPLVELPITSPHTKHFVVRFAPAKKIVVDVEAITNGAVRVYHWEPASDGWIVATDGFSAAEPHAQWGYSYVPTSTAEQRLAVTADGEVIVTVSAR